jgi:DNA-directed RNA polymerase beta' subunit
MAQTFTNSFIFTFPSTFFFTDYSLMVNLERMPVRRRKAIAKSLIAGQGQTVGRHLVNGDMVIMNRQPTLHQPSLMAHTVRPRCVINTCAVVRDRNMYHRA